MKNFLEMMLANPQRPMQAGITAAQGDQSQSPYQSPLLQMGGLSPKAQALLAFGAAMGKAGGWNRSPFQP
jgi:hypothetical protein